MHIERIIQEEIENRLFQGKVIIIYGARRVGKTTIVKDIMSKFPGESTYLNCDELNIRLGLSKKTSTELRRFVGSNKLIIIDEAQQVPDIGLALKLLVDTYQDIQIIATGSSSFDLANITAEPLTGRSYEYTLYSLSLKELEKKYNQPELERILPHLMIYGSYPDAALATSNKDAEEIISGIADKYLFKDIFAFEKLRNPEILEKLLRALALQIGSEVSYHELGRMLGVNTRTIERYINILERAFIIFRLSSLSRNPRKEITKSKKIYFYDLGIRNSIIQNFNPIELRNDIGGLWENFCIIEIMKKLANSSKRANTYFWKSRAGGEIDLIIESGGILKAKEFTWGNAKKRMPTAFSESYPNSTFEVINQENALDVLL